MKATLFAAPKPFVGHIGTIQMNAIQSWIGLGPGVEIILMGNEPGTWETAEKLNVEHVNDIECNEFGTPLISSIFDRAQSRAKNSTLVYLNADIILLSDFGKAIQRLPFNRFLMVGRRWNVDIHDPIAFDAKCWEENLRQFAIKHGSLFSHAGMDYFVFSRELWSFIPPFAVGRVAWDNWMIYSARLSNAPVVDATGAIMAIHQNHHYNHVPGGQAGAYEGMESKRNIELAGEIAKQYSVYDANWVFGKNRLYPSFLTPIHRLRARQVRGQQTMTLNGIKELVVQWSQYLLSMRSTLCAPKST